MTVVHPRDDLLEDSPGLWFRTLSSLHWRIWGGDTLHHHYIIYVHADLSTCHYNSLVPTTLLPRPLTTFLIVVCTSFFPSHRKILYETLPCFPIPRLTWCHALRSCFSIQPGNGKTGQGYIQNFSVGVGKIMHIELCPLGGVGGMLPQGSFEIYMP